MQIFPQIFLSEFIFFIVTAVLSLKLCNVFAMPQNLQEEPTTMRASTKIKERSANNFSSADTRYYQQDPYGPQTYAFGFEINDNKTSNRQFRDERRFTNGTVDGSYGYLRPDGRLSVTHYTADSKTGYLTQSYDLTSNNDENSQIDWRAQLRQTEKPELSNLYTGRVEDVQELDHNTTKALDKDFKIDVNHIDVTHDLLSPTVWNIVNGKTPLKISQVSSGQEGGKQQQQQQLGFETYEKAIPKDFQLTPFQLPENHENHDHEMTSKVAKSNVNEEVNTEMATPKPLDSDDSTRKDSDWISKIVNDTRKEFLENIPNLL